MDLGLRYSCDEWGRLPGRNLHAVTPQEALRGDHEKPGPSRFAAAPTTALPFQHRMLLLDNTNTVAQIVLYARTDVAGGSRSRRGPASGGLLPVSWAVSWRCLAATGQFGRECEVGCHGAPRRVADLLVLWVDRITQCIACPPCGAPSAQRIALAAQF